MARTQTNWRMTEKWSSTAMAVQPPSVVSGLSLAKMDTTIISYVCERDQHRLILTHYYNIQLHYYTKYHCLFVQIITTKFEMKIKGKACPRYWLVII